MEFDSCIGSIEESTCCGSNVGVGHGCDDTSCRSSTDDCCEGSSRLEDCGDCGGPAAVKAVVTMTATMIQMSMGSAKK